MLQGANETREITAVTVSEVNTVEDLKTDLETRPCKRRNCKRRPLDDSEFCRPHEAAQRKYNKEYARRRYDKHEAAGVCTRCGGKRITNSQWCAACSLHYRRRRAQDLKSDLENKPKLITSRSESDGFERTRYKGGKRGAPGLDEQDEFERKIIRNAITRYFDGVEELRTVEAHSLSRPDKDAKRMAALEQLALAVRAADDVLERNRYSQKVEKLRAERARETQRALAATAREIVKSGR